MKKISICSIFFTCVVLLSGQIPYGNNPAAANYVQTKDALIYYEIYGEGEALLLIHGSLYGYIDEFANILPDLSENFRVYAVALRGHGKSEIGDRDYSYDLFAEDIMQVMDKEKLDSFSILGFSSGAITATRIAADHPKRVNRVVSIAGALGAMDKRPETLRNQREMSGKMFVQQAKGFVEKRKQIMPEPERYAEFYDKLQAVDLDPDWIGDEDAKHIKPPVFIIGGDRDEYFPVEAFNRMHALIPDSRLLIIPESGHVAVLLNRSVYLDYAIPFLKNK